MTRIAGGGATPVKAPPRVRSSPKPRYVRPAPAPPAKPAPAPKGGEPKHRYINITKTNPPPNPVTSGGNNPRGVRIKWVPRTPKNLASGNNPRGVAIRPHRYHVAAPYPKYIAPASGGGGGGILGSIDPLAALHFVEHIPAVVAHIPENLGKDVIHYPVAQVEGIPTLFGAIGHDVLGVVGGAVHVGPGATPVEAAPQHSEVLDIAKEYAHTDALAQAFQGHFKAALDSAVAHPLYAFLDVASLGGVVGRVAGATARTGVLGRVLKSAAGTARADRLPSRVIADDEGELHHQSIGIAGEHRTYSPNLLLSGTQHAIEKLRDRGDGTARSAPGESVAEEHRLDKRTDNIFGIQQTVKSGHQRQVVKEQAAAIGRKASPEVQAAANVSPWIAQAVVSRGVKMLDEFAEIRDNLYKVKGDGPDVEAAHQHAVNIDAFLKSPHIQAALEIADEYVNRQNDQIDPELVRLGLLNEHQARMSKLIPYVAAGKMRDLGGRLAAKGDVSIRTAAIGRAVKFLSAKRLNLESAETAIEHALNDATEESEHLPDGPRQELERKLVRAQKAIAAVRTARLRGDRYDEGSALASARAALKDAQGVAARLDKFERKRLAPVVMDVGKVDGKTVVRRLSASDIEHHMLANDIDPERHVAYVNLRPPKDENVGKNYTPGVDPTRHDTPKMRRSGKGVMEGNWTPSHAAFAESQLGSMAWLDHAKSFDQWVQQLAVHRSNGEVALFDEAKGRSVAAEFKKRFGVKMTLVATHSATKNAEQRAGIADLQAHFTGPDTGRKLDIDAAQDTQTAAASPDTRYALVPARQVERWRLHAEIARKRPNALSNVTRTFRNSVLPYSPRWLLGNVVEAAFRSLLVGAGRRDAELFDKVVKRLRTEGYNGAADQLEALAGGLHYHMGLEADRRATGARALAKEGRLDDVPVLRTAAAAGHWYTENVVDRVFDFNSKLESKFSRAVIGSQMHAEMRSFGATWLKAAEHEDAWVKRLAEGYSDPKMALASAKYLDATLGKYSRFSPRFKRYVMSVAPFAPWYWNALRFVFATMPIRHPIVSSIFANASNIVAQAYAAQAKAAISGKYTTDFAGQQFGDLMSDLPVGGGGFINIGRYLPYGAFTNGPQDFIGSQILPQGQGPFLAAFAHENPYGQPLYDKNGEVTDDAQALGVAGWETALETLGPLSDLVNIFWNRGRTPESGNPTQFAASAGSGSILGGLSRTFSPAYATHPSKMADVGASSPGGALGAGGYTGGALNPSGGYTGAANPSGGYTGALNPSKGYTGGAVVGRAAPPVVGKAAAPTVGHADPNQVVGR